MYFEFFRCFFLRKISIDMLIPVLKKCLPYSAGEFCTLTTTPEPPSAIHYGVKTSPGSSTAVKVRKIQKTWGNSESQTAYRINNWIPRWCWCFHDSVSSQSWNKCWSNESLANVLTDKRSNPRNLLANFGTHDLFGINECLYVLHNFRAFRWDGVCSNAYVAADA